MKNTRDEGSASPDALHNFQYISWKNERMKLNEENALSWKKASWTSNSLSFTQTDEWVEPANETRSK
jgi:hypothetical protein